MSDELLVNLHDCHTPKIIKVIGVGGGGGNAVAHMYRENVPDVRFLVTNTDRKALESNLVPDQLQMGPGLGAGGNPVKGRELAEHSIEAIRNLLDSSTHMVFVTAGMGGGTGTGAAPVIAREARAKGILTVGVVTLPFLFERERQIDKALNGLEQIAAEVDAILVINNQRLLDIYPTQSVLEAFRLADQTLTRAVRSITEIITMHGTWNLDFEDVRTVLENGGVSLISTGYGDGPNRMTSAIHDALYSPLLNNNDLFLADRLIMHIAFSNDKEYALRTEELNEINAFMNHFDEDIFTKWGISTDDTLGSQVKVTILASGFGLYARKERAHQSRKELKNIDAEQAQRYEERRSRFYSTQSRPQHRRPRVHIFSTADLCNEQLVQLVDDMPTYRRTAEQLSHIAQQASAAQQAGHDMHELTSSNTIVFK